MSLYVVIKPFTDLKDGKHIYKGGHFYPRKGAELNEERAQALASADNAQGEPFIVQVVQPEAETPKKVEDEKPEVPEKIEDEKPEAVETFPKHTGGGHYELSDGSKAKGKEAAEKAEQALQNKE